MKTSADRPVRPALTATLPVTLLRMILMGLLAVASPMRAAPLLDREYVPPGVAGFVGIAGFGGSSGVAQSFEVGLSGILDHVEVHVSRSESVVEDLLLYILPTTESESDGSVVHKPAVQFDADFLARITIPSSAVPAGSASFVAVDLSAA